MSDGQEDQADKPYEATAKKLEDARKKGEIVRSQDSVTLLVLLLFVCAVYILFDRFMTSAVLDIQSFLQSSIVASRTAFGPALAEEVYGWVQPMLAVLFVGPFLGVIAALVAAKQVLFTGDKLHFKLNRISILANAKKKFGLSGLFEFFKTFLKFVVFCLLFYWFADRDDALFSGNIHLEAHGAWKNTYMVSVQWLIFATATYVIFSMIDIAWQIREHAKKNRMSHKEMKDEHKNEEGDETVRQQRRAKAEEIATNRMLLDVPKASVVITNPTHFAVALQWTGENETVPKCVARGTDETARKIREIAEASGVPIYRDPPTARDLFANVKVGMPIERNHYKAVAVAIGYAQRIQKMMRDDARAKRS